MKNPISVQSSGRAKQAGDRDPRVCITLPPGEYATLRESCRTFDLSLSGALRVLLELERRDGILRREIALRLKDSRPSAKPPPPIANA